MSKLTKRAKCAQQIISRGSLFQCPICYSTLYVKNFSLMCHNRHTFDIAKQGYVNLLNRTVKTNYNRQLFVARKQIIKETLLFEKLHQEIAHVIIKNRNDVKVATQENILDAGCGEGSHLVHICEQINFKLQQPMCGVGIDISKEGILAATKNNINMIWSVADLTHLPFKEEQFAVILNILSPANYAEFSRVLNDNGIIIKVVPRDAYLQELRQFFFQGHQQTYSNENAVQLFNYHFQTIYRTTLTYEIMLEERQLQTFVQMTPLLWQITEEKISAFLQSGTKTITVDLELLVGNKNRS